MAQVLVLGGGVGGLVAANTLRRKLPREHRVVLIDREAEFVFAPSFLWLMTGGRTAAKISRPLARVQRKGVEVVRGGIQSIDAARREVIVDGRTLAGDYLVVALGAELAPDLIPGLAQAGHTFYTLAGAEALRNALAQFSGGRLVILTAAPMYKCPAAPYEAAMLIESYLRKRGVREQTQIDVYAAEPGPMGVAGPEVSAAVRQMVEAKRIKYYAQHQIVKADPAGRRLTFANGVEASYDLLAYVPPHRAPIVVRESALAAESGWVAVDRHTMETKFERVYAIGDVASIPLKLGKPLPKAGVFAHAQAEVVSTNIARTINSKGTVATFDGDGQCFIETGDGKAGMGGGSFYAEPVPLITIRAPGRRWHFAKILFEKDWLRRWF